MNTAIPPQVRYTRPPDVPLAVTSMTGGDCACGLTTRPDTDGSPLCIGCSEYPRMCVCCHDCQTMNHRGKDCSTCRRDAAITAAENKAGE